MPLILLHRYITQVRLLANLYIYILFLLCLLNPNCFAEVDIVIELSIFGALDTVSLVNKLSVIALGVIEKSTVQISDIKGKTFVYQIYIYCFW